MAIMIEDAQVEQLAKQIAAIEGVSVTEVLRESLHSLAGLRGLIAHKTPLRTRLAMLAHEVDSVPARVPLDHRSDDETLGYDARGIW